MTTVGIDKLAVYSSRYGLELKTLAEARGIDSDKYHVGLGQWCMAVPPPGEDIITMAANAAQQVLIDTDLNSIEMLLFATESGIDQSKAAGTYLHELLSLPKRCRTLELKQACYAGTAALQLALPFLRENPDKKVLVIASDIARYGLNTTGESSQGAGAIAMLLSANPRILYFEKANGLVTENVMDFWRPNYLHEALVDGKYSSKLYLKMLEECWRQYQTLSGRTFADHDYFCYHTPVPRLVEKAHQYLLKLNNYDPSLALDTEQIRLGLDYNRRIGNSYTASLYVALASLLDNAPEDLTGKRIGFYSYGSGCVAEFFSGIVQPQYQQYLSTQYHQDLFAARRLLTYQQYEDFYTYKYVEDGSAQQIPDFPTGAFRLAAIENHKRQYEKVENQVDISNIHTLNVKPRTAPRSEQTDVIKVYAPGKLILSGEHSVVYGQPALAMAINRYVRATVSKEKVPQILFDLSDLAHHSRLSLTGLRSLKERVKRKYHKFISGDFSIREVLQKPFELAQFALGIFAESKNLNLPHGVKIHLESDIPMGCGMGSSAATIVSVLHAVSHYYDGNMPKDALYKLALEAENMQHGRSSGLDLQVALNGGCLYMHGDQVEKRTLPDMPFSLINTGTPASSTGQCIEKAAPFFKDTTLAKEFAAVTNAMDTAMAKNSYAETQAAIRENHKLLVNIGVVPLKVQQFVSEIEKMGGAAKICGAGAVTGDNAGALLVTTENNAQLATLCSQFDYQLLSITGEMRGVHAA